MDTKYNKVYGKMGFTRVLTYLIITIVLSVQAADIHILKVQVSENIEAHNELIRQLDVYHEQVNKGIKLLLDKDIKQWEENIKSRQN